LIQLNIVLKDVFSKIGLRSINLSALVNHQKQEIPFYFQKFKGLKLLLLLSKMPMMRLC